MPDRRTVVAIVLTLTLTAGGLGRPLPLDISAPIPLALSLVLFVGYIHLLRTLVRLPFAVVITVRRARYARVQYGLNGRDSLRDGFLRGFLETRRWTVRPLALVDRLAVVSITLLATTPVLGMALVRLGGVIGVSLLLVLYLVRGTFGFLVADSMNESQVESGSSMPFLNIGE